MERRPADKGVARPIPETPGASGPEIRHGDPSQHAAELLGQAERLTQLAGELRSEAERLNAALEASSQGPEEQASPPGGRWRRFVPTSDRRDAVSPGAEREPQDLPLSDGARLMITNLATTGSSREEILELMRDELGLEDAEAILDSMRI
jgi:hypothetical protein